VNPTNDTISFARPHHLQSGDRVIFEGFTDKNGVLQTIGGLTPGQPYCVWVIDPTTIKLTANPDQATASGHASYLNSFTAADVSSSTINLPAAPTHPLSDGEAVTYHGPQPDTFSSAAGNAIPVQVTDPNTGQTVTTIETDSNGNPVDNPGASNIVIPGHGFSTGDNVLYQDESIWQLTIPNHRLRTFDRVVYNPEQLEYRRRQRVGGRGHRQRRNRHHRRDHLHGHGPGGPERLHRAREEHRNRNRNKIVIRRVFPGLLDRNQAVTA
jgi:hypothetical protein